MYKMNTQNMGRNPNWRFVMTSYVGILNCDKINTFNMGSVVS